MKCEFAQCGLSLSPWRTSWGQWDIGENLLSVSVRKVLRSDNSRYGKWDVEITMFLWTQGSCVEPARAPWEQSRVTPGCPLRSHSACRSNRDPFPWAVHAEAEYHGFTTDTRLDGG